MGVMDYTYHIRFLRESDIEDILELDKKLDVGYYISKEELLEMLGRTDKTNIRHSFTIRLNKGDGLETLIGVRLADPAGNLIMEQYDEDSNVILKHLPHKER
jgi:hypothetical protein